MFVLLLMVFSRTQVASSITNFLVLAVAIITSRGNIKNTKVCKILVTETPGTMVDNLDITQEQILHSWEQLLNSPLATKTVIRSLL